ncbi:unnamed protein product [Echinostoma caproni]|uniref:Retrotrans_gag domain-containing protein n=1 Tax=Echinostoma caproni TaxID=27848 RepID=A0A183AP04_9TREM|nr:unnamed protein product [Echinostoma caproni]
MDFDLPNDVERLFVTLRRRLAGPKMAFEYREEFCMRQQRPEESLMGYIGSVRRLTRLANLMCTAAKRNSHILYRFLAELRKPRDKVELHLRPPKDLAAAESMAEILDQNGYQVRRPQGVFAVGFRQEGRAPTRENGERKPQWHPRAAPVVKLGIPRDFVWGGGPSKSIPTVDNANNFTAISLDMGLPFVEVNVEGKTVN